MVKLNPGIQLPDRVAVPPVGDAIPPIGDAVLLVGDAIPPVRMAIPLVRVNQPNLPDRVAEPELLD